MNLSIEITPDCVDSTAGSLGGKWVIPFALSAFGFALYPQMPVGQSNQGGRDVAGFPVELASSTRGIAQVLGESVEEQASGEFLAFVQEFAANQRELDPDVAKLFAERFADYLD